MNKRYGHFCYNRRYESVLTCINYCRSIVVIVYCVLSIFVILINIILVMCDIDYCRFYSIYVAILYVDCGPVYCMPPAHLPCVHLQSCNQQNERPRDIPLARVV